MVYNTDANVRAALGFAAATPAAAAIAYWQGLIDAMIVAQVASPNATIAAVVELNRINQLWNNQRTISQSDFRVGKAGVIAPLTEQEIQMLESADANDVDIIPMYQPWGYPV